MFARKASSRRAIYGVLSTAVVGVFAQQGLAARDLAGSMTFDLRALDSDWSRTFTSPNALGNTEVGGGTIGTGRGGSGDAALAWNNAAGGAWNVAGNWNPAQVPTSADDTTFGLASTYTVNPGAGATASTATVSAGNVTWNGGTVNLVSQANPGVGAAVANPAVALGVGTTAAGATLTINGGAVVDYTQAYVGLNPGSTGTLNISGAGTIVRPGSTANTTTNGRFGTLAGSGVINVTDGAEVKSRLYEFGRQDTTTASVVVNVNTGGKLTSFDAANGQVVLPRSNGGSATLNFATGGTADLVTMFSGAATNPSTSNLNVDGVGSLVRVSNVFVTNGGGLAGGNVGTTTINVTNGGKVSLGRLNGNQDGGTLGSEEATKTIVNVTGPGSTLEISNGTGFANSYIVLGQGANSVSEMNVTGGANVSVTDTDGDGGSSFTTISSTTNSRSTVNVNASTFNAGQLLTVGGDRSTQSTLTVAAGSTMNYQSQLSIASSDFATGSTGATATVSVTGGSKLLANGDTSANAFIALDRDDTANITVSGAGSEMSNPGGGLSFGGGNQVDNIYTPGGGTSNLTINSGGLASAEFIILARDPGAEANTGARTTINVDGVGSAFKAIGADDPNTAGIGGGVMVTAVTLEDEFGFEIIGSGDATHSTVNINVTNGGLFDAEEAMFLGDNRLGSTTVTVSGAGSVLDAGRQLTFNGDNLPDSVTTVNVSNGGVVRTTSSTTATEGSILLGAFENETVEPLGTTKATVNLTGAGSTLSSSASIFLGGTFDEFDNELLGSPAAINAGAGTTVSAAASVLLASNSTISTAGTVNVAGVSNIGGIWTISGGNPNVGTVNLYGAGQLKLTNTNGSTPTLLKTDNIQQIGAAAKLDVGMNAIRIRPEGTTAADTDLADVKAFLAAGRITTGEGGITSSALSAGQSVGYRLVSAPETFLGESVQTGDILVRATWNGDTNLNGSVTFDDLLVVAQNYTSAPTGNKEWYLGDFTFDGNVNFDDLLALAQNYNNALLVNGTVVGSAFITDSFAGDWAMALSLVPEPTSLAALGLASAFLGRRRSVR